jgi:anti-sigma factor RsiW
MALAASLTLFVVMPDRDDPLTRDLVAAHVRSLMPDHLTDVASSDRHTVKPWFNGRLPASPPVPDLASDGFPMVYRRNQHVINLFAWPAAGTAPDAVRRRERNGFHVIEWLGGDMRFAAVSDVNWADLETFRQLWSAAAAKP